MNKNLYQLKGSFSEKKAKHRWNDINFKTEKKMPKRTPLPSPNQPILMLVENWTGFYLSSCSQSLSFMCTWFQTHHLIHCCVISNMSIMCHIMTQKQLPLLNGVFLSSEILAQRIKKNLKASSPKLGQNDIRLKDQKENQLVRRRKFTFLTLGCSQSFCTRF